MELNKKIGYFNLSVNLIKIAIIVHLPNGKWRVESHKGKNLGTYKTKEEAKKRLRQVEFFKHKKAELEGLHTYTEIARKLNEKPEELKKFQSVFKNHFDQAYISGEKFPEEIALNKTMEAISKKKV